jgi:hypothetical protein
MSKTETSIYSELVSKALEQSKVESPAYTAGSRMARILVKVKAPDYAQFLRQLVTFDTVPLVLKKLPVDLANDDVIFNAVVRTQHKLLFNEDWQENLTDSVKEYYLIHAESIDRTHEELNKPLK